MTATDYSRTRTDDLRLERKRHLKSAEDVVERATNAHRDLTSTEENQVNDHIATIKAIDIAVEARGRTKASSVFSRLGPAPRDEDDDGDFFDAEAKAGIVRAVKSRTTFRAELDQKAALTSGTLLPTSGVYVQGGLHPNAQFPLSSLFVNQPADGPTQRYYRMTSGTAATVPEAGLKPDAGIAISPVDLPMAKLAATAQYTREMAEDAPYLVSHLSTELQAAILAAFTGTSGILTKAGATADVIDLIADAIASEEAVNGITPTAVIANPTVVAAVRKAKASTSGTYVLDPLSAQPTLIHGVQVISSPVTPAATAWVVDASGVIVYRRGSLVIEVGTNADDFVHNLSTVLAEERMGTAVVRPTSLCKLTLS